MTVRLAFALTIFMAHGVSAAMPQAQPMESAAQPAQGVAPAARDAGTDQGQITGSEQQRTESQREDGRTRSDAQPQSPAPTPTPAAQQSAQPLQTNQSGGWYWLQIFGAASVGAIVVKLLDILWLTPATWEAERRKWLRDQRLTAYAEVARDVLSFRLGGGQDQDNPFQAYAVASRAILLAHNDDLAKRIDQFIIDLDHFYQLGKDPSKQAEGKRCYEELSDRARKLVADLRGTLVGNERCIRTALANIAMDLTRPGCSRAPARRSSHRLAGLH